MIYQGTIIEESLEDKSVLKNVTVLKTKIEPVVEKHQTPWLKQWALHAVEIKDVEAEAVANDLAKALEIEHPWYADYKNETTHYIIFRDKVFKIDRTSKEQYDEAKEYGISLGIPTYQVDFSPRFWHGKGI
jgi:hypothetical protein